MGAAYVCQRTITRAAPHNGGAAVLRCGGRRRAAAGQHKEAAKGGGRAAEGTAQGAVEGEGSAYVLISSSTARSA